MALRIDSYGDLANQVGKETAEQCWRGSRAW